MPPPKTKPNQTLSLSLPVSKEIKGAGQSNISKDESQSADADKTNNSIQKGYSYTVLTKLSFYLILIGVIVSVNAGWLEWFLDTVIGVPWSGTLVHFLKEETKGLLVLFLVVLYLEITRKENLSELLSEISEIKNKILNIESGYLQIHEKLDNDYITQLDPNSAIEKILKENYQKNLPVKSLISTVLPDRPFYTDAYIELRLFDNPINKELFNIVYEMRFFSNIDEFIIAIVPSTTIQDQIAAFCPSVNETFTIPDPTFRKNNLMDLLRGSHSCRVAIASQTDLTKEESMKFQRVSVKDAEIYLHNLPKSSKNEVILLRCVLPKNYRSIFTSFSYSMKKDIHFYYWVSDRPIFAKRITIDAVNFSLVDNDKISFHPMFACTDSCKDNDPRQKVFSADINNWLVKGQGIAVSWGEI